MPDISAGADPAQAAGADPAEPAETGPPSKSVAEMVSSVVDTFAQSKLRKRKTPSPTETAEPKSMPSTSPMMSTSKKAKARAEYKPVPMKCPGKPTKNVPPMVYGKYKIFTDLILHQAMYWATINRA